MKRYLKIMCFAAGIILVGINFLLSVNIPSDADVLHVLIDAGQAGKHQRK